MTGAYGISIAVCNLVACCCCLLVVVIEVRSFTFSIYIYTFRSSYWIISRLRRAIIVVSLAMTVKTSWAFHFELLSFHYYFFFRLILLSVVAVRSIRLVYLRDVCECLFWREQTQTHGNFGVIERPPSPHQWRMRSIKSTHTHEQEDPNSRNHLFMIQIMLHLLLLLLWCSYSYIYILFICVCVEQSERERESEQNYRGRWLTIALRALPRHLSRATLRGFNATTTTTTTKNGRWIRIVLKGSYQLQTMNFILSAMSSELLLLPLLLLLLVALPNTSVCLEMEWSCLILPIEHDAVYIRATCQQAPESRCVHVDRLPWEIPINI